MELMFCQFHFFVVPLRPKYKKVCNVLNKNVFIRVERLKNVKFIQI